MGSRLETIVRQPPEGPVTEHHPPFKFIKRVSSKQVSPFSALPGLWPSSRDRCNRSKLQVPSPPSRPSNKAKIPAKRKGQKSPQNDSLPLTNSRSRFAPLVP